MIKLYIPHPFVFHTIPYDDASDGQIINNVKNNVVKMDSHRYLVKTDIQKFIFQTNERKLDDALGDVESPLAILFVPDTENLWKTLDDIDSTYNFLLWPCNSYYSATNFFAIRNFGDESIHSMRHCIHGIMHAVHLCVKGNPMIRYDWEKREWCDCRHDDCQTVAVNLHNVTDHEVHVTVMKFNVP